jgi:hypothetical protein
MPCPEYLSLPDAGSSLRVNAWAEPQSAITRWKDAEISPTASASETVPANHRSAIFQKTARPTAKPRTEGWSADDAKASASCESDDSNPSISTPRE